MSDKHIGIGWTMETNLTPPRIPAILVESPTFSAHTREVTRYPPTIPVGIVGRSNSSDITQSTISNLLSSPTHGIVSTLPGTPTRKRKLTLEDVSSLKKKLTETDAIRLKKIQSTFAERCAIQCFLQNNGLPAEYPVWRSHIPVNPLVNFLRINRLKSDDETEDLYSVLRSSSLISAPPVKSLAGDSTSRLSSPLNSPVSNQAFDKRIAKPARATLVTQGISSPVKLQDGIPANSQEQIVERAKQEAYVMQRIAELQRDGLWSEKRLPKVFELPRPKAHWDYVLEEMTWLAADFAQERKWKKAAARKCAFMVKRHLEEKMMKVQKADEDKELHLRKIASTMAEGVREFWANIEKLVELKRQVLMKTTQKSALGQQLNLLIDSSLVSQQVKNQINFDTETQFDHNMECIINN